MQDLDHQDFDSRQANGLKTRKEIIGAALVEKNLAASTEFDRPMMELLNTYCFNDVWNRPGLSRAMRSMLVVGLLTALNRPTELKIHINTALTNGVSRSELQEVLLQCAVYCGVPAGVEGFRTAKAVFAERDASA